MHQLESDLRSRLRTARLPVMPQILLKLIERCQADDAGMNVLAELISKDPGITSKVLGIANSSAYHRAGRTVGLEQALATLGTDMIKTLVINESVFQVFNNLAHSNGADLRAFWKHSLSTALLARDLAARMHYPNGEEAYLAGLLHDVGRLALLAAAAKEYAFLFFALDDHKLCDIERSLLNLTHSEAGALLADRWDFDSFIADSLLYHHQTIASLEHAHTLVRIVAVAHLILEHETADEDPAILNAGSLCGIPPAEFAQLRQTSLAKLKQTADMLGIDLSGADDLVVPTDGWEIAGRLAELDEASPPLPPTPDEPVKPPPPPQESARRQLVEEVRNVVLTAELRESATTPLKESATLIETIARSARLLFEFSDVAILRANASGNMLIGIPMGEHRQRLAGFSANINNSPLSQAVLRRQVVFLEQTDTPNDIGAEQLMRLLGGNALVCLPIVSAQHVHGVLIGAVGTWQLPQLKTRERFLRSFGELAAAQLQAAGRSEKEDTTPATADSRDASRRLVHEANNALSIIKNYLGVLDNKLEKQQSPRREVAILHEEVDRVGRILKGAATTSSTQETKTCEGDTVIRHVVELFNDTTAATSTTRITAETLDAPCEVGCPAEALKQILVNLIKNAIEAMPESGEIHVVNHGRINRDGTLFTSISVSDNGPGIPQELMASLFSPVNTTKGDDHQGLGLSIVHGLVKQSNGLISCRSNTKGTLVEILFPTTSRATGKLPGGIAA